MKTLHFLVPTLSGKFSLLSESFLTGLSELHFTWQKDYFEKYPLWVFRPSFSDIEQKISVILSNVYQLGCQNCMRRFHKRSSSWIFFLQKSCRVLFITLGLSDKKILLSDKNISTCLSKVQCNCPLEQFEERFSLETFFWPVLEL